MRRPDYPLPTTHYRLKKGFTLVELLVVITIIGVLTSIVSVSYNNAVDKSRDGKRKQALAQVKAALTLYAHDNGQYPPNPSAYPANTYFSDGGDNWIPGLVEGGYIQQLPKDPKQAGLIYRLAQIIPKFGHKQVAPQPNSYPEVAAVTTAKSPTVAVNDASIGGNAWANPTNALTSDSLYARATQPVAPSISNYLKVTGFGFTSGDIPAGSAINGILVGVQCQAKNVNTVRDYAAKLVKGGVIQATNRARSFYTSCPYPSGGSYTVYGGSTDLWGTTWTLADITSANFGFVFAITNSDWPTDATLYADLNHIQITVYYSPPTPPTVTTLAQTNVTSTSATLNSSINPNGFATTAWYRYGTSNVACGSLPSTTTAVSLGSGTIAVPNPQTVTLTPSTTYYFCAVANNSSGTTMGAVLGPFTTLAPAASPSPTIAPSASPTVAPSPSPGPSNCAGKQNVYCYWVSTDRSTYILWALLDNKNDSQIYNQPSATCKETPADTNYNYCLKPD